MAVNKINNAVVAKELLPMVWRVRPFRGSITKVDIIGDLVPERPVYVIKSWGSFTPESMAYYYAVAAKDKDAAVNKFIEYCKASHKVYAFLDKDRYSMLCYLDPANAGRFDSYADGYIEKEYFDIKEFNLQDFVVEYMKVM